MTTIANTCEVCSHRFPGLDPGWHDRVIGLHEAEADDVMYLALEILNQGGCQLEPGHLDVEDVDAWHELLDLHFGDEWWAVDAPPIARFLEELIMTVARSRPEPAPASDELLAYCEQKDRIRRDEIRAAVDGRPAPTVDAATLLPLPAEFVEARRQREAKASMGDVFAVLTEAMHVLLDSTRAELVEVERQLAERAATSS